MTLSNNKTTTFNCSKHGDYEEVARHWPQFNMTLPINGCPTCKTIKEEEERRLEAQQRDFLISRLSRQSGLPPRFTHSSFDNYEAASADQCKVLDMCKQFAADVIGATKTTNLLLLGSVGTGKTHLAAAILNACISEESAVKYVKVRDLIREVRDTWKSNSQQTESEVINSYASCDLLILDEIGVQAGSDNERTILFDIVDTRYGACLPTMVISNLDLHNVEKALGERVIDRLREDGGKVAICNWASHRRQKPQRTAQPLSATA